MLRRQRPSTGHRRHTILAAAILASLAVVGGASGGANPNSAGHQPPANSSLPTVAGTPAVGQTLTGNAGGWTGPRISYAYQWLRCDSSGGTCSPIAGATGTSYAVVAGDVGATFRFAVTATNPYGSSSATSSATIAVQSGTAPAPPPTSVPPASTSNPTIAGTPTAGQALSATTGSWSGTTPMTYGYAWRDCDASGGNCAAIAGATSSSYTLGSSDVGHTVRVVVTATNSAGQASATSAATSAVQGTVAPPPPTAQPSFPIRAAFYYPWFPETWTVNGAHVFYHPTLGYYSTTDLATEQTQLRAMQYAGINAAISSWWGQTDYTNTRLKQLMQTTVAMGSPVKWAIYHEGEGQGNPTVSQIASDLAYIRDNLASSSAYLRVGGKFVVFVYNANDTTCDVATRWKQANDQLGDPAYVDLKVFAGYRNCTAQPDSWHQYGPNAPSDEQPGYSYSIAPGFWRADASSPLLARDPSRWQSNVTAMVASHEPWQLVTTFNEWTEGTAVESAQEWASASGYGTYLDALHNAVSASTSAAVR